MSSPIKIVGASTTGESGLWMNGTKGQYTITSNYINMWVMDKTELRFPFTFNSWRMTSSQDVEKLKLYVTSILPGTTVVIIVTGLLPYTDVNLFRFLAAIGSTKMNQLGTNSYSSYCLLGKKGSAGTIPAFEKIGDSSVAPVVVDTVLLSSDSWWTKIIKVAVGEFFNINLNGVPLNLSFLQGLNILTFTQDFKLETFKSFDVAAEPSFAPDMCANYLKSINSSTLTYIATKGDVRSGLNQAVLTELNNYGSHYITDFLNNPTRNGWFMLGRKNHANTLCEASSNGDSNGIYFNDITDPEKRNGDANSKDGDICFGLDSNNRASQTYNNLITIDDFIKLYSLHTGTGFLVVTVSQVTGLMISNDNYQVGQGDATNRMISKIESVTVGTIVLVIASKLDVNFVLDNNLANALASIGGCYSYSLTKDASYVLIGRKGAPSGSVPEAISFTGAVSSFSHFNYKTMLTSPFLEITLKSLTNKLVVGESDNNQEYSFTINGVNVPSSNQLGINVMLIEPMNGEIILSRNYSPQSIQSNSDQLSQLIESLPDKHYVFISCDNESGTRLNDRFKNTISKHLSNRSLVQTLENGSYCTIGQINRAEQQRSLFIENFTNDTDSTICSVRIPLGHLYHEIKGNSFSVNANQNSSTITLNGKSIIGKNEILSCDGLNVVVLEPNTREPKHFQYDVISHQTLWTEFNRMITTLPIGTVVAIAIQKSRGPFPSDQSIAIDREIAFNLIGSCQFTSLDENESFALIGYKGTSPGCALEQKSLSSAAVASMEPPQDEVVYETKSTDKTLFNVPLFQGLQKLMKPVSTLEIENATGHVYGIEPAYSFKSVTIPRNLGVGVKRALIVGMSYNYSAAGRYRDADYIARQHAQALVSCGYIDSADSIKIMTETNTQTNMTPTYTNISNQITTWLQSTSNSGDSIYLAFIGRGFTTVFNKSDEDNFQGGYTFLANDGKTLQFVIYSNFQALFNSIPSTVNRSVLVDSSYSTEIALPNNYSPSNYVNNTNIISSLSFNQKPFISQQSCGFVEALNIIMAEQNRAGLPLLTYDNIITKLTNNPLYIGGQLPQLFASTPYKIFLA